MACEYILRAQAQAWATGADTRVSRRRAAARICSNSRPSFPHTGMPRFGAAQLFLFFGKSVKGHSPCVFCPTL
eukprot:76614-Chlamydomonas_euryale.AAC.1